MVVAKSFSQPSAGNGSLAVAKVETPVRHWRQIVVRFPWRLSQSFVTWTRRCVTQRQQDFAALHGEDVAPVGSTLECGGFG